MEASSAVKVRSLSCEAKRSVCYSVSLSVRHWVCSWVFRWILGFLGKTEEATVAFSVSSRYEWLESRELLSLPLRSRGLVDQEYLDLLFWL